MMMTKIQKVKSGNYKFYMFTLPYAYIAQTCSADASNVPGYGGTKPKMCI